jgi:hypothetical protein
VVSSLPTGWQVFGPGDPVEEPGGPTQYPPGPDDAHPSRSTGEPELRSFFLASGVTEENMPSDLCVSAVLPTPHGQSTNANQLTSIDLRLLARIYWHWAGWTVYAATAKQWQPHSLTMYLPSYATVPPLTQR